MNLLLDTHIAIWALNDDAELSQKARNLILDSFNIIYYSVISVWEVHLKHNKNPKNIPFSARDFSAACQMAGFVPLNLRNEHVLALAALHRPDEAKEHNDPFDRLLISQAKAENMVFLTHDSLLPYYGEQCIMPV